jgi:hypothetical protein
MNLLTQEWICKAEGDFASAGRSLVDEGVFVEAVEWGEETLGELGRSALLGPPG